MGIGFASESVVDEAIKLHGTELQGRQFIMDYAAVRSDGFSASREGAAVDGEKKKKEAKRPPGCTSIVLNGLAETVTEKRLMKIFQSCAKGPRNVNIVHDKESG